VFTGARPDKNNKKITINLIKFNYKESTKKQDCQNIKLNTAEK